MGRALAEHADHRHRHRLSRDLPLRGHEPLRGPGHHAALRDRRSPYIDARFAPALAELALPGVHFRDLRFVPTFHKHAGRPLRGVQLHVTDRETFAPVRTAVAMLATLRGLYPEDFAWLTPDGGAAGTGHRHFIDLLWGSDRLRRAVDAGDDPLKLCDPPAPPARWAGDDALLYA